MTTERNLREELLKQDGGGARPSDDLRDKILAQDQARVAMVKRLTIYSWILVGMGLAVAGVFRFAYPDTIWYFAKWVPTSKLVFEGLLLLAIIFTISFYIRSRTLTMRQILANLARIEEHLRKLSQKE